MDQQPASAPQPSCQERIEQVLADAGAPLTQKALRDMVRMRTGDVGQALATLIAKRKMVSPVGPSS